MMVPLGRAPERKYLRNGRRAEDRRTRIGNAAGKEHSKEKQADQKPRIGRLLYQIQATSERPEGRWIWMTVGGRKTTED